jgi:hypothetical protein
VFDYGSQAKDVRIDFTGNSDQTQQAGTFVGSPAASIYGGKPGDDYHDEGMPSAKTTFNVDNDPQPGSANDAPVFMQAPPTVSAKPPQVVPVKAPDREHVAPLKARDAGALLDNLGSLEAILDQHGPAGIPAMPDGSGAVAVYEKTPTPTPVTDMVEHQYNQYGRDGKFVAAITRKRIESELTGGIRDISKPVFDWDKGLHQYRVGIAGLRILEQLIAQNQQDASGQGETFTPEEVRQMKSEYQAALDALSRKGVDPLGRDSFSKILAMEASAAASVEERPLRKAKRARTADPNLAVTDDAEVARQMADTKLQKDFSQGN